MKAKVSVILPSLNVADYIGECMDSVAGQSLEELEIICVDAGSTDGTAEILKECAERDARVKLLHSGMKSYGRQVNMGLDCAEGEYIAVVETDDWIEQDMYRRLYERAAADGLDYAAGDFDTVTRLQSGYDYAVRQRLFPDGEGWKQYGQVLGPDQIARLRAADYVLWKGIYRREFLNASRIRLHESPGAAFQDMGFLQQVKTYARRAVYVDESFYRYRQGREAASSGALEGLAFYEEEFRWLNGRRDFLENLRGEHRSYYYFTMSISFLTKYEQILSKLHGEWRDERLEKPYGWLKGQVSYGIDSGLLQEGMYGKELWERLTLLLASREEHARVMMEWEKEKEKPVRELLHRTGNRPAVIFGCGMRGERLMLFCDRNHIPIIGFSDNRQELHGGRRFGFPVMPPTSLKEVLAREEGVVLLAMREGAGEVLGQLEGLGIPKERVFDMPQGI